MCVFFEWWCVFLRVFLDSIPEDPRGAPTALIVGVGVHPQGHCRITMAERLRHTDHIRAGGNRHASEGMAEFMRVKIFDSVPFGKLTEIVGRAGWMHRLQAVILGEDILSAGPLLFTDLL